MLVLQPHETAQAAAIIYEILDPSAQLHELFPPALSDGFDLVSGKKLSGKSGGKIIQSTTGFALAARGKSIVHKDDALLVIRGTKKLADWITDANAFFVKPNGTRIHSGFNKVFESLKPQLEAFFVGYNPSCVHIIGHSLGGAIGTLVAEWIKATNKASTVKLYTFGCPRVGLSRYAETFTNLVKPENIYRVYNPTDVIPMVPTFPYVHVPLPGTESYASHYNTVWTPVSIMAHFMSSYLEGVRGQTWEELKKPLDRNDFNSQTKYLLGTQNWASLSVSGIKIMFSVLGYILNKILLATGAVFDAAAYGANTVLDMMAMYLEKGARAVKEVAGYLTVLMRNILKALGIIASIPKDITAAFIRWVFQRLSAALNFMAKSALRSTF